MRWLIFDMFLIFNKSHEKTKQHRRTRIVLLRPCISYSSVPRSSFVFQNIFKTYEESHFFDWMTQTSITLNKHTVVYSDSVPHTPFFFSKNLLEAKMHVNPRLKIVPNTTVEFTPVSVTFAKDLLCKSNCTFVSLFLKMYVLSMNERVMAAIQNCFHDSILSIIQYNINRFSIIGD